MKRCEYDLLLLQLYAHIHAARNTIQLLHKRTESIIDRKQIIILIIIIIMTEC